MNMQKKEDYCSLVHIQTRLGLFVCIFSKEYTINVGKFYSVYKLFTKEVNILPGDRPAHLAPTTAAEGYALPTGDMGFHNESSWSLFNFFKACRCSTCRNGKCLKHMPTR